MPNKYSKFLFTQSERDTLLCLVYSETQLTEQALYSVRSTIRKQHTIPTALFDADNALVKKLKELRKIDEVLSGLLREE